MRYLKKFESSDVLEPKVLRDDAEDYLCYLLDNGDFAISASSYRGTLGIFDSVLLSISSYTKSNWKDVKDDILPYLEYMNGNYDVELSILVVGKDGSIANSKDVEITLEELESNVDIIFEEIYLVINKKSS